ncbi:MAG: DUF2330 domain-containing protein [Deltaproteobacteria bacterium]|nr:DUF2330 domain-containing protein [Deltaproteobacteria bacterium]
MKRAAATTLALLSAVTLLAVGEKEASACGGCVVPPNQTASDITDERMLLSVSPQQTTLYDQIRYAGSPEAFAWVLPIAGTVDVGLSADILFNSVDSLTATRINPPPVSCPARPAECNSDFGAPSASESAGSSGSSGGVTVLKEENVGPYATVQLKSTDPQALTKWLTDNGFQLKPEEKPIVEQYVSEGFDFLALKLLPNKDVRSMRPVRVTSQGSSLALPLRMAAVGTGAKVGITIWVVSDGRYEPQNFPFYRIEDKDLVWDFGAGSSNYTTIRSQKDVELGGRGWELQSSLDLNQQNIRNLITQGAGGFGPQSQASNDYLAIEPNGQSPGKTAEQVRSEDIGALFAGMSGPNVRVTRMRSDISKAAMNVDFYLQASADQSQISNVRNPTKYVNLRCPVYANCSIVGYAPTPEDAAAQTAENSNNGESFACTTTKSPRNTTRDVGISAVVGAIGLALVHARRRRNRNG